MLRLLTILLVWAGFMTGATASVYPKYEIRATWLTTLGGLDFPSHKANSPEGIGLQKEELCKILDRLKQANFNTVLMQTRLRGDVIYPSAYEGFAESLTGHTGRNPGYDLLRFAIEECHERGMELHAWIVVIPIGNKRQIRLQGKSSVVKKRPKLCKLYQGNWFLDPGNPDTEDYLAGIVREIVSNYDIDGIHLDYIRYPEHPKKFPDSDSYRKYGKKRPIDQWRRDNITRIVRRLYRETKALKPWVKVSSSPVGKYRDTRRYTSQGWNAYHTVYQDAQLWLKEGIHDAIFPMMYFRGNHFYPFALDWQENKLGRWVVPGLGIYFMHPKEQNWTLDEITRQIRFIRDNRLDGQAFFRNRHLLDDTKGILSELNERFYTLPAVVPPMTWADSLAPAAPLRPVLSAEGHNLHLSWEKVTDTTPVTYRIYASNTFPVDTERAENLIVTRTDSTRLDYTPATPWEERIYWAVTAVDRFGNESTPAVFNRPQEKSPRILHGELPAPPTGCTYIIGNATGEELLRLPRSARSIPENIGKGFFRIDLLKPDGTLKPFGVFVR